MSQRAALYGLALVLVTAANATAGPVWFLANDPNTTSNPTITAFPISNAKSLQWAATTADFILSTANIGAFPDQTYTSLTLSFGNGVTGTVTSNSLSVATGHTANGQYAAADATNGKFLLVYTNGLDIVFNQPIQAFSFFATDLGDGGGTTTMEILSHGAVVGSPQLLDSTSASGGSILASAQQNGAISFIGVDDPGAFFTEVRFINTGGNDAIGMSNIEIAVPEPVSFAMFATAALALGALRRASRSRKRPPTLA